MANETVALARNGLDELRFVRRILERLAQPGYGAIEAVIEVDEGVCGPKLLAQFLACNNFARTVQEHGQDPEGLFLELDLLAALAQFRKLEINLEDLEAYQRPGQCGRRHGYLPLDDECTRFVSLQARRQTRCRASDLPCKFPILNEFSSDDRVY